MQFLWLVVMSLAWMNADDEKFEVASIRRAAGGGRPVSQFTAGGGVQADNVTLRLLIQMAYDILPAQLSGGAGWTDSEQYQVVAKGPGGASGDAELSRKRLQSLLAERFHLSLRREARAVSGYALTVAKNGHKMTASTASQGPKMRQTGRWELRCEGVSMTLLAKFLSVRLGDVVVDASGLEGGYDFTLQWTPGRPDADEFEARGLLMTALQEQLGLKVEAQKSVQDRYVIERAERPAEN